MSPLIAFLYDMPAAEAERRPLEQALFEIGCRLGLRFGLASDRDMIPADALVVRYGSGEAAADDIALPYSAGGEAMLHPTEKPLWGVATPSGVDVVRGVADLLSARVEATVPDAARSAWGGFEAEHHPLTKAGAIGQPLVEYAAGDIRKRIAAAGHDLPAPASPWGAGKRYAAVVTHDIDGPQIQSGFALARSAYYALRYRSDREQEALELGILTRLLGRPDPYWNFADWMELERRLGLRATYYFYVDKPGGAPRHFNDPHYDLRKGAFPQTLRDIHANGSELGIHYGIRAHGVEHYRAAADVMRSLVGADLKMGGRAHYWSIDWRNPARSWRELEEAGYRHDSSVSPMALGFRFGSAQCTMPTRLDDTGAAERIVVTPTAIMDAYVAEPRPDAKLDERLGEMHGVIDRIADVGGICVLDWHERTLANRGPWRGYMFPFLHAMDRIVADSSAVCLTMAEAADAWRQHVSRYHVPLAEAHR
ncbi:polysaccharide deacetylase family protein [Sphingopyxis sp. MSC1_008]|uniref:hypothetical protein n=1 Tax=Sphingopyxis sp. MSC1_008 TaxID=2909265 RepID=UPI0020BDA8EF|nr:hypothetical protein [Sphingopyxis sp. MSC1_008]